MNLKNEHSEQCKFKNNYRNKLCQYKHKEEKIEIINNEYLDKVTESIHREKVKNVEADILDPITWCEVCICDYES